jgi:apolipoprotein N-acyltransferase
VTLTVSIRDMRPDRIRARIVTLQKWPRRGLLFGCGAFAALAHAPVFFFPALALGLVVLIWALDGASRDNRPLRAGFGRAFVFALGYFCAGTFWIAFAFFSRGWAFTPFGPFAVLGASILLALFWGMAGAVQARMAGRGAARIIAFALLIFAAEWLRGHVLTEFPWNLPAYVWQGGSAISQSASIYGAWGLSLVSLLVLASPASLAGPAARLGRYVPVLAALLVLAGLYAWGARRLSDSAVTPMQDVRVRLVQIDMPQREKWAAGNEDLVRARYLAATTQAGLDAVTHVIWPEGALPVFLLEDGETLGLIGDQLYGGPVLVAGTARREIDEAGQTRYYNSVAAIRFPTGSPRVTHLYDKVRLVPFGEYIPLAPVFRSLGIDALSNLVDGYSSGPGPDSFEFSDGPPAAILVCYEIVYPGFAPRRENRPGWIINVSNDSWFGPTAGPSQHLNIARYRAIEDGLTVIRSASGGISGAIDPYGRLASRVEPYQEGAHDIVPPNSIEPTVYSRFGNTSVTVLGAFFLLLLVGLGSRRKQFLQDRVVKQ